MKKIIFIVGVESQLGSALFSYLKEKNITVYASTRRKSSAKNNSFIDLNSPSKEWEIPDQITDAVFFSSLTNFIDAGLVNPGLTERIIFSYSFKLEIYSSTSGRGPTMLI